MDIDLLDVGVAAYGDSILCRFDDTTVMIDGAHPGTQNPSGVHPSIPEQLGGGGGRRYRMAPRPPW